MEDHQRRPLRLPHYDYASNGAYFVTVCTNDSAWISGWMRDTEVLLNKLGEVVREEWLNTEKARRGVSVDTFIVMPNHTHVILLIEREGGSCRSRTGGLCAGSLSSIVGQFKSVATKRINVLRNTPGAALWQRSYYDRVIRDEGELNAFREYISENILRWFLKHLNNHVRAPLP